MAWHGMAGRKAHNIQAFRQTEKSKCGGFFQVAVYHQREPGMKNFYSAARTTADEG